MMRARKSRMCVRQNWSGWPPLLCLRVYRHRRQRYITHRYTRAELDRAAYRARMLVESLRVE